MAGAPIWLQGLLFLVVSILLLYFTRPVVKKKLKVGKEKTNVNALIGKEGLVLETIRPFSAGQVKLDGLEWSAAAADPHMTIESGTAVKVEHIEAVSYTHLIIFAASGQEWNFGQRANKTLDFICYLRCPRTKRGNPFTNCVFFDFFMKIIFYSWASDYFYGKIYIILHLFEFIRTFYAL